MIILGIPMHAMCGGMFFADCRLRTLDDGSFGVVGTPLVGEDEDIALAYTNDGYVYGFETKTTRTGAEADHGPSTVEPLPVSLPERIVRIERRRSYRATCPEDDPVTVVLGSGIEEAKGVALAISEESVGLALPPGTPFPEIDSIVTMVVSLPRLGDITATGTVRFIRDVSTDRGLVIVFDEMSKPDRNLLRHYIRVRRIDEQKGESTEGREGGFLVTRRAGGQKHSFWCPAQLLGRIDVLDEALEVVSVDALRYL